MDTQLINGYQFPYLEKAYQALPIRIAGFYVYLLSSLRINLRVSLVGGYDK
jgi:hypothetical protein